MKMIYPKGSAMRFTCGTRCGEVWFLTADWYGGAMHLGEWSSKENAIINDGVCVMGEDIVMMMEQAWA